MIIDSSAIMALLLTEPERDTFVRVLASSNTVMLSAGGWMELSAVLTRSNRAALFPLLDAIIAEFAIKIAPTTVEQARIGHDAYRKYGIGSGDPAHLNFGDCFAYALAKDTGEPLLFKGNDFTHTDIASAVRLPPPP